MIIYNEKHIATARTVQELITILSEKVPADATIDCYSICHCADAEVWYDEGTNTVILK
jgi:hypothetical protein